MAYSDDPNMYREEDLRKVAELRYIKGHSHAFIEEQLGIRPRQKLIAMCRAARNAHLVRSIMMPSATVREERLHDLEDQVREHYKLLACRLVTGREEMLENPLDDSIRQVIIDDIARDSAK